VSLTVELALVFVSFSCLSAKMDVCLIQLLLQKNKKKNKKKSRVATLVPDGELILYTDYCSMLEQVCMQLIVKHEHLFLCSSNRMGDRISEKPVE
jgi:hypothetical protein